MSSAHPEAVEQAVERLLASTECPYARKSRWAVWSVDTLASGAGAAFRNSLQLARRNGLDGVVAGVSPQLRGERSCDGAIEELLRALGKDSRPAVDLDAVQLRDPEWWFVFDEEPLFVIAFSPDRPASSSRYAFESPHDVVVFQRRQAFQRRFPGGIPDTVRLAIQLAYRRGGRPYLVSPGVIA